LEPGGTLAEIDRAGGLPPNAADCDPDAQAVFRYCAAETNAGRPITADGIMQGAGLPGAAWQRLADGGCMAHEVGAHVRAVREGDALRRASAMLARPDADIGFKLAEVQSLLGPLADRGGDTVRPIDAAAWLATEPTAPDYILADAFEVGARVMLVGASKTRKSFAALQLAVAVAAGADFLGAAVPRARRVLLANLENPDAWQHRRLIGVCRAMGITADRLADRLAMLNGRGRGMGLEAIEAAAARHGAELVLCDPLYKLDGGADESDQSERKRLVGELEAIGHRTGAALVLVCHDPKDGRATATSATVGPGLRLSTAMLIAPLR